MAANATAVWRVRPSGSNNNGGGFDCAISPAATGTNGSFTSTTFTDTVAAAFSAGQVGSSINISGIGQYKITAFINSTNITLGSGNPALTLSSGLTWTIGSGQDYSQQNAAQVTQSGGTVSTSTTTLTDTGASFTTALIGNAIRVAGTGITTTWTYITAVPSGTTLTLQTSPGTTGTTVTYNIGGAWADFWTNTTATLAQIVPGNTVYILGTATPNPSSYTYDYTFAGAGTAVIPVVGTTATGPISYANDPATPGYKAPPDTTGGMPVIKTDGILFATATTNSFIGLWFVQSAANGATKRLIGGNGTSLSGIVHDHFGFPMETVNGNPAYCFGCEIFTSVNSGSGAGLFAIEANPPYVFNCNIHDTKMVGVYCGGGNSTIVNNIIAKNALDGIQIDTSAGNNCQIIGNTVDGNAGHGVNFLGATQIVGAVIFNNIISNHQGATKIGLRIGAGTVSANDILKGFIDYNTFYNNLTDVSGMSRGPHATYGGANPYVGQSTENYTLA